jgi:DNA-binding PadR family transcriptional regulator
MTEVEKIFKKVEHVASTRPVYSMPNFLPRQVFELAVLSMLENQDYTGDVLIRELAPISRRAVRGFGVNYPLLHDLEEDGLLRVYSTDGSPRRVYALTKQGHARLEALRHEYSNAGIEQYQTGLNLIYGLPNLNTQSSMA